MTRVLALTGGIGSGKSTVGHLLQERGARCIDADAIVHALLEESDGKAVQAIRAEFGPSVMNASQMTGAQVNRVALSAVVFHDDAARHRLEAILHPLVRARIGAEVQKAFADNLPLLVIEVPLLFETGMHQQFAEVWLVTSPKEQRLQRVCERDGVSHNAVQARMLAQWPDSRKEPLATVIIRNGGTLAELSAQVDNALRNKVQ